MLVDRADLEPVLRSLFAAGYRLLDRLQVANSRRPAVDDALAMAHLSKELALMSPHGACVEIHHRVDPTGTAFPTAGLLARTETIEIWNRAWPVLSTTDLFAYICAHHAGHRWSRLHWVLDLSMMRRHPSFDADAVLGRATAAGVRRVVEAAMDLPEALAAMVREAAPSDRPRGLNAAFVAGCIAHLDPQDAPEQAARRARGGALLAQAAGGIRYQMRLRDGWPARLGHPGRDDRPPASPTTRRCRCRRACTRSTGSSARSAWPPAPSRGASDGRAGSPHPAQTGGSSMGCSAS